jgi:type IV secretion system protein VirB2
VTDAQYTAELSNSVEACLRLKKGGQYEEGGMAMRLTTNIKWLVLQTAVTLVLVAIAWLPTSALGQIVGGGPFSTGARNFKTSLITILAPIAVVGVMVIGVAAWFNRISWGWAAAAAGGLILVFGAPQIVSWIRGMAGV